MSASERSSWDTAFFAPMEDPEEDGTKVAPEDPEKAPAAKKIARIKNFDLQLSFWLENTEDKKHESAVYFWRNFWNVVDDVDYAERWATQKQDGGKSGALKDISQRVNADPKMMECTDKRPLTSHTVEKLVTMGLEGTPHPTQPANATTRRCSEPPCCLQVVQRPGRTRARRSTPAPARTVARQWTSRSKIGLAHFS